MNVPELKLELRSALIVSPVSINNFNILLFKKKKKKSTYTVKNGLGGGPLYLKIKATQF